MQVNYFVGFQWIIIMVNHSPLWDVLGGVALLGELVVDKPELAALLAGGDPVQADVELGTVVGVGVPGRFGFVI